MPSLMILWYYYYYHYYDIMIYDIKALRNFMSCQLFNVLLSFDQYRLLSGYLIIFNNNNHLYDNRKKLKPVALGGRCEARPASKHCWWSRRRTCWEERSHKKNTYFTLLVVMMFAYSQKSFSTVLFWLKMEILKDWKNSDYADECYKPHWYFHVKNIWN